MIAITCLVVVITVTASNAEIFTAMAEMEDLLYVERDVGGVIDQYIQLEMNRLERLKELAKAYQKKNQQALRYGMDYMANPVNAYLLIKRLTADWTYVENMMRNNNAEKFLQNITSQRDHAGVKFPDVEDLNGAAIALMRLRNTYNLQVSDLAEGRVVGAKNTTALEAHDCFELGRIAYNQGDYYHTLMWMEEALARVNREQPPTASEGEILEYLAFALFQQDNVKRALVITKRLYQLEPEHPRAKGNIKYYEEILADEGEEEAAKGDDDEGELPPIVNPRADEEHLEDRDIYEALCRGEIEKNETEKAKLYSYYKNDLPYLKLAPIKAEILHWKPKVILFRQVISDEEIEIVKELAAPKLARARVQNPATGYNDTAPYRISKLSWLMDSAHEVVARITKRAACMSNYNMTTSEHLQVNNYGLGGYYEPHFDYATVNGTGTYKGYGIGNRIATMLFYLSKPEAGGATVFPRLNLTLFPSKNDAVFWHNLYRNGEGDPSTRHAGCPVLAGVKWVSNKWIHEKSQEFRRPCGLAEDDYE